MSHIVLGIDPGLQHTGWGILSCALKNIHVSAWGVLSPKTTAPLPQRLLSLWTGLQNLLDVHKPTAIALEKSLLGKGVQTSLHLSFVVGMCYLIAGKNDLPVDVYAPTHIKKAMTGNGHADKHRMRFFTEQTLGCAVNNHHSIDALAVAFLHITTKKMCRHNKKEKIY